MVSHYGSDLVAFAARAASDPGDESLPLVVADWADEHGMAGAAARLRRPGLWYAAGGRIEWRVSPSATVYVGCYEKEAEFSPRAKCERVVVGPAPRPKCAVDDFARMDDEEDEGWGGEPVGCSGGMRVAIDGRWYCRRCLNVRFTMMVGEVDDDGRLSTHFVRRDV